MSAKELLQQANDEHEFTIGDEDRLPWFDEDRPAWSDREEDETGASDNGVARPDAMRWCSQRVSLPARLYRGRFVGDTYMGARHEVSLVQSIGDRVPTVLLHRASHPDGATGAYTRLMALTLDEAAALARILLLHVDLATEGAGEPAEPS
ncbi:hypothetical protein [Williamsia sp.]|uniref:hypothetical protein n=1 Tax=Williamsia sp. TaxID=1872085 RepID=UPI002F952329